MEARDILSSTDKNNLTLGIVAFREGAELFKDAMRNLHDFSIKLNGKYTEKLKEKAIKEGRLP